jgi:predicted acylesterase/phospholipase RssA
LPDTPLPPIDDSSREVRVLALDGGGLRGIFSAALLARWEADFNTSIVEHFDLITGSSTGGIIALGLGLGLSPLQLVDLYAANAASIFPPRSRRMRSRIGWLVRPRYDATALRDVLAVELGDRTLGESAVPVASPSYDLINDDVHLFRTPHHPDLRRDWRVPAIDVALAASAAPTYLPAHRLDSYRLVDGGVWANNPTLLGVVEAIDRLDAPPRIIRVLSVGTTTEVKHRSSRLERGGLWSWRRDALDVVLRGQSLAATNHARLLVGRPNVTRVDVQIPAGLHALDQVDRRDLLARADAASRTASPQVSEFMSHTPAKYTPFYPEADNVHTA